MGAHQLQYVLTTLHGTERNQFERTDSFVGDTKADAIKNLLKFFYDKFIESIVIESIDSEGYVILEAYSKNPTEGFSFTENAIFEDGDARWGEPTVVRTGSRKLSAKDMFGDLETLLVVKDKFKEWKAIAGRMPKDVKCVDISGESGFDVVDLSGFELVGSSGNIDAYSSYEGGVHNHAKGVVKATVEGFGETYLPLKKAASLGVEVLDATGDVLDLSKAAYSRSCGYYDKTLKVVYRLALHGKDTFVTTLSGKTAPKENCTFVHRHNGWEFTSAVVETVDGKKELSPECANYEGTYLHFTNSCVKKCWSCGSYHHENESEIIQRKVICQTCEANYGCSLDLKSYSTDVLDHTDFGSPEMKINGESLYLGFELETRVKSSARFLPVNIMNQHHNGLNRNKRYAVATSDGSLHSRFGLEYIFRPNSIKGHEADLGKFLKELSPSLRKDAGNGYGLHVHVSSHFLSDVDKINIQNFVSYHEDFCRKIGGRSSTEYQRKKNFERIGLKTLSGDRYNMVNTQPCNTIEFRFAKSVIDQNHIMCNLELALAVTLYCKYHASCMKMKDLAGFKDYILRNKKQYKYLNSFLAKEAKLVKESLDALAKAA